MKVVPIRRGVAKTRVRVTQRLTKGEGGSGGEGAVVGGDVRVTVGGVSLGLKDFQKSDLNQGP